MSKQVEFLVKLRDSALMLADAANEYLETLAPKAVKETTEKEDFFNGLNFEKQTGEKLGIYETADLKNNNPEKFNKVLSVLKDATIQDRFHGSDYVFSYWLYNNRIYRQKLKK